MSNILEVSGLSKSYGDFILSDISFALPEDCITGFIGINGAGKTTIIRTILGLATKANGAIRFFGNDMQKNGSEIKNRKGVVLDDGCFYDCLTISEMKSILAPAYSQWNESVFTDYLERFTLNPKQKISTLSRGMKMKFALTLALSHEAELLIMDEPTSGLDPLIRSELLDILVDFMKQGGKGVLFSTHITSDIDKIADMLLLIDNGRLIFQEEKDVLLDTHRIVKGDPLDLSDELRHLFLHLQINDYGFWGITKSVDAVKKACLNGVIIEKPSVEDIMLAYVGGMKK